MKDRKFAFLLLFITLLGFSSTAIAQRASRVSDYQIQTLLNRIESRTNSFRRNLDNGLDRSRYDGTRREDNINAYVTDFAAATDRLRERFRQRREVAADIEEVLNRGMVIDNFMRNNRMNLAQQDWNYLRTDLDTLARYYNVSWRWDNGNYSNSSYQNNSRYRNWANRFSGTYRLDISRSDNADNVIDRAIRGVSTQDSDRLRTALQRRMMAPDQIAIDQSNRQFTIVSSTARQVTFDADGRSQTETRPNGRTVRTTTSLNGNRLVVSSMGDRGSDFSVTFESIDNGNGLRVTRELYTDRLSSPVSVHSIYTKTSEVANLNIFEGRDVLGANTTYDPNTRFYIPSNTRLTAVLNTDLSTRNTNVGDRFTLTVRSPREYEGAEIEGVVSKVERSGRLTGRAEMVFDFQQIRMPNGATYNFAGYIEQVNTANGDRLTVDNEGSVRDESKQSTRTTTRAGIGAAIGAILGGITGGGKGAVLGAVLGGGAGAGTVILQGRDDLNLMNGTEFIITAVSPRNSVSLR